MYGYCLQLVPEEPAPSVTTHDEMDIEGEGGRTTSLSMVFTFNKSDWTSIGWASYLEGFTLYYSALDDQALEPAKSILLSDVTRGVPIVSLRQRYTKRLGYPFSECKQSNSSLKHYKNYTRNQCLFECLLDQVHSKCNCSAPYFPVNIKTGKLTKPLCKFSVHSSCVAPILEQFNYAGCNCPPKCKQVETHHEAVQYGQYFKEEDWSAYSKNNSMIMTSMMLYLSRSSAVDEEVEEYSHTQLWSDIGGASGLMLGMSFATFIGILDWVFSVMANIMSARARKISRMTTRRFTRRHKRVSRPRNDGKIYHASTDTQTTISMTQNYPTRKDNFYDLI